MTKTLLETGEQCLLVVGINMDHSVGCKAWQGDRPREKIGPRDQPKHLAFGAHSYPGRQQHCCRPPPHAHTQAPALVPEAFGRCLSARRTELKRARPSGPSRDTLSKLGDSWTNRMARHGAKKVSFRALQRRNSPVRSLFVLSAVLCRSDSLMGSCHLGRQKTPMRGMRIVVTHGFEAGRDERSASGEIE